MVRPLQPFPQIHGLRRKRYASLQVPLQAVHSRHSPHCPFSQAPPQFSSPQMEDWISMFSWDASHLGWKAGDVNMYTYCTYVNSANSSRCFYISVIFATKQHWTSWLLLLSTSFWIFFYNSFLTLFLWQVAGRLAKRAVTFDMPICRYTWLKSNTNLNMRNCDIGIFWRPITC